MEQQPPNSPEFEQFLRDNPCDIVIFERFHIEEQFSWKVRKILPKALRVLDTQDLHHVRYFRELLINEEEKNRGHPFLYGSGGK